MALLKLFHLYVGFGLTLKRLCLMNWASQDYKQRELKDALSKCLFLIPKAKCSSSPWKFSPSEFILIKSLSCFSLALKWNNHTSFFLCVIFSPNFLSAETFYMCHFVCCDLSKPFSAIQPQTHPSLVAATRRAAKQSGKRIQDSLLASKSQLIQSQWT